MAMGPPRARRVRRMTLAAVAAAAAAAIAAKASSVVFAQARGAPQPSSPASPQLRGVFRSGLSQPSPSVVQRKVGVPDGAQRASSGFAAAAARAAATAGCCALVVSAAARAAGHKRLSGVLMRMYPSNGHKRQKVLRRLEKYGAVPAWSRKPLHKKRLITPWFKRGPPHSRPVSDWGRRLMEKQRVRFHYNIREHQLAAYMVQGYKSRYPVVRLLQILESRLDNVIWRLGCAPTMAAARFLITGMHVQYRKATRIPLGEEGWRTQTVANTMLGLGDQIRIRPRESSLKAAKKSLEEEGNIPIPDNLDWDRENLVCTYTNIMDPADFGIEVEEKFIFMWYAGPGTKYQKSVRRPHVRYFPGTDRVIHRRYNGGLIRQTPENKLNMKKGLGLRLKGRLRPPCLWGRTHPLNNPYEVGKNRHF